MRESAREPASRGSLARFQAAFTAYIRDPEHARRPPEIPPERMELYARLVFGNVERVMANMFPVMKSCLAEERWQALVRVFFRDYPMHDPLFRTMPQEFVTYLQGRPQEEGDPPYLLELAHYEWVDYALSVDETEIDLNGIDDAGDLLTGRPALNPLVWMLTYQYPVQTFRTEPPPAKPPESPIYLVAVRGRDDRVAFLELNAVSAHLLELIDERPALCGQELLEATAADLGEDVTPAFYAGGREILERLRARDVILGTR
jgi:hypothetical protein